METYKLELTEEECIRLESLLTSKMEEHDIYLVHSDKRKIDLNKRLAYHDSIHKNIFNKLRKL